MKNKLKDVYFKLKKLLTLSVFVLFMGLFFVYSGKVFAANDLEISFYVSDDEVSVFYDYDDNLDYIPELTNEIFVGWYDNLEYTGVNYYGSVISSSTPTSLFGLVYNKITDFEFASYESGYEVVEYKGTETYVSIPAYYYEETTNPLVYVVSPVLSINASAFSLNNNLEYLIIPDSVINIDLAIFNDLDLLLGIYVDSNNLNYSSDNYSVLLNKDQTEILHYPKNSENSTYVTPETLITIKEHTFVNTSLKEVKITSNVTIIETEAFINNQFLEKVLISDGALDVIGDYAFKDNPNLALVMIPRSVSFVGVDAFINSNLSLNIYYQDKIVNIPTSWDPNWNESGFNVIEEYDLITFTVTYLDDDLTLLDTEVVSFNGDALGFSPTKEADLEFTYIFNGWTGASLLNITSDTTVTASYYKTTREYMVTFYDAYGDVYGYKSFRYGEDENNNYWFTDVTKAPDAQYTYTFSGWNPNLTFINGDVNAYPVFSETLNKYNVIFYQDDGGYYQYNNLDYGTTINAPTVNPTKNPTAAYTYSFAGWFLDDEKTIPFNITVLTENLEVYPKFTETLRSYKVDFYNGNVLYDEQYVNYGSSAVAPLDPTKASNPQYHYTFTNWSVPFVNITGYLRVDAVYEETLRSYDVSFYSDSILLHRESVNYGASATAPIDPVKEATLEYTYTFDGWDKEFNNITSSIDVNAVYLEVPNSYIISYQTNGGSTINQEMADYNSSINAPIDPFKTGYTFTGWYSDIDLTEVFIFNLMPAYNLTLYAGYNINTYTITFNSNGGPAIGAITDVYNKEVAAPADPVRAGHTFTGWYSDINLLNLYTFSFMPAENITLYAGYIKNSYLVSFNTLGGTIINSQNVLYNALLEKPIAPLKTGYTFTNWYKDISLTTIWNFNSDLMPAENMTLYAGYNVNNYNISFESNGGSTINSINRPYNSLIVKPTNPSKVGYTFTGWYREASLINLWDFEEHKVPAENITLYAGYSINNYTITFNSNGGSETASKLNEYNTLIIKPADPFKTGYTFTGWYREASLSNLWNFETDKVPANNLSLYAGWVINDYTITFDSNGGSNVSSITLPYNSSLTAPINPFKTGHTFSGWYSDINLLNLYSFSLMPAENITLFAGYNINTYTISFLVNGGSATASINALYNTIVNAPANPFKTGYSFTGWYSDAALTNLYTFSLMPAENVTLYAGWSINNYTITFEANGGSNVSSITLPYNSSLTAPTNPFKTGHTFSGWYSDTALTNLYTFSLMPAEDITLYAGWLINSYMISFEANGGPETSSIIRTYGSEVIAPVDPLRLGYTFTGWYSDINLLNLYTFSFMPAENITLFAGYSINTYTISFEENGGSSVTAIVKEYNQSVTAPLIPEKTGYSFSGWYSDAALTNLYTFSLMPAENITLYAGWLINSYKVTFYQSELGVTPKVVLKVINVNYGSDITVISEIPSKPQTNTHVYTFNSWSGNLLNVTEEREIYPTFNSLNREYTVNFYNGDQLVVSRSVYYEQEAIAPADPVKEGDIQYTYLFLSWDKTFDVIRSDLNVYALYEQIINKYNVSFYNEDVLIVVRSVNYGASASAPANPIKESSEMYDYTFISWDQDYSNITGNLNVYATYEESLRKYVVKFYNEDVLIKESLTEYGTAAVAPIDPVKDSTLEYTYTFISWDQDYSNITSDLNVYANYEALPNSYLVSFISNGGSAVASINQSYNTKLSLIEAPTKSGYEFAGWYREASLINLWDFENDLMVASDLTLYAKWNIINYQITYLNTFNINNINPLTYNVLSDIVLVNLANRDSHVFVGFYDSLTDGVKIEKIINLNEDITLYARWEIKTYSVKFYDFSNALISTQTINHGMSANAPELDVIEGYTFSSWSVSFVNVISDLNVTANYTLNSYVVNFNSNGSIISFKETAYNSLIIKPTDPTMEGFSFVGWYKDESLIEAFNFSSDLMPAFDLNLYAKWMVNSYTVTFNSMGGSSVLPANVNFEDLIIEPTEPSKVGYSFVGWYKEESYLNEWDFLTCLMVDYNITLYAKWEEVYYVVTFYDDDNSYLGNKSVRHGENASFLAPVKEATEMYNYTFSGWSLSVNNVTSDLTVYATYVSTLRSYQVVFYSKEIDFVGVNPVLKSSMLTYGSLIVAPSSPVKESSLEYNYTFINWDKEFNLVKGEVNIYPVFASSQRSYEVIFYDDDLVTILKSESVLYGTPATAPVDPVKDSTVRDDYHFSGWSVDFSNIVKDLSVYATYETTLRVYQVNFYSEGVLIKESFVEYGKSAVAPATPTKTATPEFIYTFTGYDKDYSFINSDLTLNAVFEEQVRRYTVYFYDDNKWSQFGNVTVNYGEEASLGFIPTKEADREYMYTFSGWDKDLTSITENIQTYATYERTLRSYQVSFYDDTGTNLLKTETVFYGAAATAPIDPVKASSVEFDYSFTGWNLDYTFVDGTMLIYAMFKASLRSYQVSFYNEGLLHENKNVLYGSFVGIPNVPLKESTNMYNYLFSGWYIDEELMVSFNNEAITGNISLYAKFDESLRGYQVRFYNNGILYNEQTVSYGTAATRPIDPVKASTEMYNYTFISWDKDFSKIESNLDIDAIYSEVLRTYKVYFYDGVNLLDTKEVYAGSSVTIADPVKDSTQKFTYTFVSWDKDISNVLSDLTVNAVFTEDLNSYMVYFYDSFGNVIKEENVFYGYPAIAPEEPIKESTPEFIYTFISWNRGFSLVYDTLHISPLYKEELRDYQVRFYSEGVLIKDTKVLYHASAIAPTDPVKASTEMYNYTFISWDKDFSKIESNLDIEAIFKEEIKTFIVTFYDSDGLIKLSEQEVTYGSSAEEPTNVEKAPTSQHEYTFTGWSGSFNNVTSNLNLYARYSEALRSFTVNFYYEENLVDSVTVLYGQKAVTDVVLAKESTEIYNYIFKGWSKDLDYVFEDLNVYAEFTEVIKKFEVTFYNDLKTSIYKRETVNYGASATAPTNITKAPSLMYNYIFTGWDKEFNNVTGDLFVYAEFSEVLREFSVKFYNDDNTLLKEEFVTYGLSAFAPAEPEKEKTDEFSYIFKGWDKEFNVITNNLNVYATYEKTLNSYNVTYYDYLDNVIKEEKLPYGFLITPPTGPNKESDLSYNYTFSHWDGFVDGMTVNKDLHFKPIYLESLILYTIIIIVDRTEHRHNLPYLSPFPSLQGLKSDTNKYIYMPTGATTSTGVKLDKLPTVIEGNLTLTIIYKSYVKEEYLINYINSIDASKIRSYQGLIEANEMFNETLEKSEAIKELLQTKVDAYNELVEITKNDLKTVKDYESLIFKGMLKINISLQLLSYAMYVVNRRWF